MTIQDLPQIITYLSAIAYNDKKVNEKNEIKRLLAQDPTTANIEELVKIYKVII